MKLSVMVITYNHEPFIAQTLESTLAQRVDFDYEIVVGEDCSTDGTRDILIDFCRRYPGRIVPLIREQNMGMMRNLEETLSACRGQYIALIEGDDYWTCVDKLQKQVDFLDAHPDYTICCHRVQVLNEMSRGQVLEKSNAAETNIFPSRRAGKYTVEDLLTENFIMTCTIVLRHGAVGPLPKWFRELKVGDWPLCALAARSGSIYLMDEIMAAYRVHSSGVWSSQSMINRLRACIEMLRNLEEHLDFKYRDKIHRTIARYQLSMARHVRNEGNRSETAKLLFDFIRSSGLRIRDCRPEFRYLAGYVVFGSWHGMSVTTQLIQRALSKFGYKLVRVDGATNSTHLRITRL